MLCGVPSSRPRRPTWMMRKDVLIGRMQIPKYMPWSIQPEALFARICNCNWSLFFELADNEGLAHELPWATQRAPSRNYGADSSLNPSSSEDAMAPVEYTWYNEYLRQCEGQCSVIMLNQNPFGRPKFNNSGNVLCTVIRDNLRVVSTTHRRLMCPREALFVN